VIAGVVVITQTTGFTVFTGVVEIITRVIGVAGSLEKLAGLMV